MCVCVCVCVEKGQCQYVIVLLNKGSVTLQSSRVLRDTKTMIEKHTQNENTPLTTTSTAPHTYYLSTGWVLILPAPLKQSTSIYRTAPRRSASAWPWS